MVNASIRKNGACVAIALAVVVGGCAGSPPKHVGAAHPATCSFGRDVDRPVIELLTDDGPGPETPQRVVVKGTLWFDLDVAASGQCHSPYFVGGTTYAVSALGVDGSSAEFPPPVDFTCEDLRAVAACDGKHVEIYATFDARKNLSRVTFVKELPRAQAPPARQARVDPCEAPPLEKLPHAPVAVCVRGAQGSEIWTAWPGLVGNDRPGDVRGPEDLNWYTCARECVSVPAASSEHSYCGSASKMPIVERVPCQK